MEEPTSVIGKYAYRKLTKHIKTLNELKKDMPEKTFVLVYKLFIEAWGDALNVGWMSKKYENDRKEFEKGRKEGSDTMARILRGDFRTDNIE